MFDGNNSNESAPIRYEGEDSLKKRLVSPRLEGILEQFERARLFLNEAQKSKDRVDRFRRLVASIYFSRAIVELMLEAADKQEVSMNREDLETILIGKLTHYMLIYRLRIHDFHRFGLLERPGIMVQGPIKLKVQGKGSTAAIVVTPQGLKKTVTHGAQIDEDRPLNLHCDQVYEEEDGKYLPIEQVVSEYLAAVPSAIDEFKNVIVVS